MNGIYGAGKQNAALVRAAQWVGEGKVLGVWADDPLLPKLRAIVDEAGGRLEVMNPDARLEGVPQNWIELIYWESEGIGWLGR